MSLFRVVIRDRLVEGEVRPYEETDLGAAGARPPQPRSEGPVDLAPVPENLDLNEFSSVLLLVAAQEKADALLAQTRQQAESLREKAFEEGFSRGRAEAKKDMLPALVAFADAGQSLIVFEERLVSRCTPEIVRLALEIAGKIVDKTVAEDAAIVASVLERAKKEVMDAKSMRIWLHPKDYELLTEIRPDLVKIGPDGSRQIEVVTTEEIERGGCRLETEIGQVDAVIPTQIDEISRQLLDEDSPGHTPTDLLRAG